MVKLLGKFDPTTGASRTRPRKKLSKCDLDEVKIDPKEWITKLKLIRGELWKLNLHIDDMLIMT